MAAVVNSRQSPWSQSRSFTVIGTRSAQHTDYSAPANFSLGQNHPNPFSASSGNSITTLNYQLLSESFVTLEVFDVLGRKVATLVKEVMQPGRYTVHWAASGFPSGVYFSVLHAGVFVESKRMVVTT